MTNNLPILARSIHSIVWIKRAFFFDFNNLHDILKNGRAVKGKHNGFCHFLCFFGRMSIFGCDYQ